VRKSTVIVISPLNAIMRDQIVKLKEGGLVLKGDRVASTDGDQSLSMYQYWSTLHKIWSSFSPFLSLVK